MEIRERAGYTIKVSQEELNLLATAVGNIEGGMLRTAAKCGRYDIAYPYEVYDRLNEFVR